jgi:hypothetical protein
MKIKLKTHNNITNRQANKKREKIPGSGTIKF